MRQTDKYIEDALDVSNMVGCKARSVPGRKLSETDEKQIVNITPLDAEEHSKHRAGVGKLLYMLNEYADTVFAVKRCSTR